MPSCLTSSFEASTISDSEGESAREGRNLQPKLLELCIDMSVERVLKSQGNLAEMLHREAPGPSPRPETTLYIRRLAEESSFKRDEVEDQLMPNSKQDRNPCSILQRGRPQPNLFRSIDVGAEYAAVGACAFMVNRYEAHRSSQANTGHSLSEVCIYSIWLCPRKGRSWFRTRYPQIRHTSI